MIQATLPIPCASFLELRTATGALLAHGDLLQVARDREIESRMVFHFSDASVFEEAVTFTQHGVFTMQNYHLVQRGPPFADDLEVTLSRSGQYVVKTKSHKDRREKQYTGKLEAGGLDHRLLHPTLPILRICGSHYFGPQEIGVRTPFKPFTIDDLTQVVGSMLA